MIKPGQVLPRRNRVASLASGRLAILELRHAFAELSAMRIAMAGRARPFLEAELCGAFKWACGGDLVTFRARDSNVTTGELEARVLVLRQGEGRWPESLHSMAVLAAIQVRRRCELSEVDVSMAVGALSRFDLEESRFTCWDVALRAGDIRMLPDQRIRRGRMLF